MRIAILHYTKPPVIGGVERVVGEQAKAFRAIGHEVVVCDRTEWDRCWKQGGLDLVLVHNVFTMPFDLLWTTALWELAQNHPEVRWVNWVHDVAAANQAYASWDWDVEGMGLLLKAPPNCRHVSVSSARMETFLKTTGARSDVCRVVPNGIDPSALLGLSDRMDSVVRQHSLWTRGMVLVHPTRYLRRKNLELAVRLLAELARRGVDAVYLVSGAPDPHQADGARYSEEIRALAVECKVTDRFHSLGHDGPLSDEDVRGLYAVGDLVFFPSHQEGFGLPLLEAEVLGVPALASDIPAHREIGSEGVDLFDLKTPVNVLANRVQAHEGLSDRIRRRGNLRRRSWEEVLKETFLPWVTGGDREAG